MNTRYDDESWLLKFIETFKGCVQLRYIFYGIQSEITCITPIDIFRISPRLQFNNKKNDELKNLIKWVAVEMFLKILLLR